MPSHPLAVHPQGGSGRLFFILSENSRERKRGGQLTYEVKEVTDMEVWKEKVVQDINDIKQRQRENENSLSALQSDVHKLQITTQLQDKEINTLKETLKEIKDDTNFIRKRMDQDREEQLKQYKNMTWKIVTAIVVAGISIALGIQL